MIDGWGVMDDNTPVAEMILANLGTRFPFYYDP